MKKKFELVFAAPDGKVYPYSPFSAVGMKAGHFFAVDDSEWMKLPPSSELFLLPGRSPVGLNSQTGRVEPLPFDPYSQNPQAIFAVAAFISPGHSLLYHAAYQEGAEKPLLPLFAYGACAYFEGDFYVSAMRVDWQTRHEESFMNPKKIQEGVQEYTRLFPKNRLIPHLAHCATVNGCANAKNFFHGRLEAPIPSSPVCNAQCLGCISFQPANRGIVSTQNRLTFIPSPAEITEIALAHFEKETDPLLSFGQGCEGEPTLSGDVMEEAIRLIRSKTKSGLIHVNTNASRPDVLEKCFKAGLDSMRVSLNSVRDIPYARYYQPKGYTFETVRSSIRIAKKMGKFVSLNYLSMPGFTDSTLEFEALKQFIADESIDMIQWRNLNYDPMQYFRDLQEWPDRANVLGMRKVIDSIHHQFPKLMKGYFNPQASRLSGRSFLDSSGRTTR